LLTGLALLVAGDVELRRVVERANEQMVLRLAQATLAQNIEVTD
jgi:hypothetical protein